MNIISHSTSHKKIALVFTSIFIIGLAGACSKPPESETESATEVRQNALDKDEKTILWAKNNMDTVLARHEFDAANGMTMPYRLFEPENTTNEKLPLLIFLHGRGDRGTDNRVDMFKNVGLFNGPESIISPAMQKNYPSFVLIPQCSDKTDMEEWAHWIGNTPQDPFKGLGEDGSYKQHPEPSDSGAAALALIDKIIAEYAIDADRVYITGKSMGGFGTWEFISRRPELFAAAVPMAGYSDPAQIDKIKHLPIWIFHGDQDEYNPVAGSRNMANLLGAQGAEIRYSEFPGANHGESFKKAWENRAIIPWMYSKKRNLE